MKQHLFLGDTWLGSRDIPTLIEMGESPRIANSYALFCPRCASVWGRLMHEHPSAYCQPISSFCAKHAQQPSDATFTANSPWHGDPRGIDGAEWPSAILRHDIAAMCNFFLNNPDKAWRFL